MRSAGVPGTHPKRRRHPNHRLVKIHRSYTVEEIARLFGSHRNTVRRWLKRGLRAIDTRRPIMVRGRDLSSFLQAERAKNKRKCQPGEIYCVRCRAPKSPAGDMIDYQPVIGMRGNLIGICPTCNAIMCRAVSLTKLELVRGHLAITLPQALQHIGETGAVCVNGDFSRE